MSLKVIKLGLLIIVSLLITLIILKFYYAVSDLPPFKKLKSAYETNNKQSLVDLNNSPSPNPYHPPQRIKFSSLNKELSIEKANIVNNEWELYEDKVSWLSTSSAPGQGNVILYAHNYPELFGNLDELSVGDLIELEQYSEWLPYEIKEIKIIAPNDTQAILSQENQLTLYTCDGSFDEKRLVIQAFPVKK